MKAKVILILVLLCVGFVAATELKSTFQYTVHIDSDGTDIIFTPAPFAELIAYEEELISGRNGLSLRVVPETAYRFNVVSGGMQTLTIYYRNLFGKEGKEIFEITVNSGDCMTFVERQNPTGITLKSYTFTPKFTE